MPDLRYERFPGGHYAIFTMDRPDRLNAQGAAMRQELREALDEFAADSEMRAGIVTGAGRAFSAGADLKEMSTQSGSLAALTEEQRIEGYRGNQPFGRNPKPFIAAVNGLAIGAGELAADAGRLPALRSPLPDRAGRGDKGNGSAGMPKTVSAAAFWFYTNSNNQNNDDRSSVLA